MCSSLIDLHGPVQGTVNQLWPSFFQKCQENNGVKLSENYEQSPVICIKRLSDSQIKRHCNYRNMSRGNKKLNRIISDSEEFEEDDLPDFSNNDSDGGKENEIYNNKTKLSTLDNDRVKPEVLPKPNVKVNFKAKNYLMPIKQSEKTPFNKFLENNLRVMESEELNKTTIDDPSNKEYDKSNLREKDSEPSPKKLKLNSACPKSVKERYLRESNLNRKEIEKERQCEKVKSHKPSVISTQLTKPPNLNTANLIGKKTTSIGINTETNALTNYQNTVNIPNPLLNQDINNVLFTRDDSVSNTLLELKTIENVKNVNSILTSIQNRLGNFKKSFEDEFVKIKKMYEMKSEEISQFRETICDLKLGLMEFQPNDLIDDNLKLKLREFFQPTLLSKPSPSPLKNKITLGGNSFDGSEEKKEEVNQHNNRLPHVGVVEGIAAKKKKEVLPGDMNKTDPSRDSVIIKQPPLKDNSLGCSTAKDAPPTGSKSLQEVTGTSNKANFSSHHSESSFNTSGPSVSVNSNKPTKNAASIHQSAGHIEKTTVREQHDMENKSTPSSKIFSGQTNQPSPITNPNSPSTNASTNKAMTIIPLTTYAIRNQNVAAVRPQQVVPTRPPQIPGTRLLPGSVPRTQQTAAIRQHYAAPLKPKQGPGTQAPVMRPQLASGTQASGIRHQPTSETRPPKLSGFLSQPNRPMAPISQTNFHPGYQQQSFPNRPRFQSNISNAPPPYSQYSSASTVHWNTQSSSTGVQQLNQQAAITQNRAFIPGPNHGSSNLQNAPHLMGLLTQHPRMQHSQFQSFSQAAIPNTTAPYSNQNVTSISRPPLNSQHNQYPQAIQVSSGGNNRVSPAFIDRSTVQTAQNRTNVPQTINPVNEMQITTCFLCGRASTMICCGNFVYCSVDCKSEDFERHKSECKAVRN